MQSYPSRYSNNSQINVPLSKFHETGPLQLLVRTLNKSDKSLRHSDALPNSSALNFSLNKLNRLYALLSNLIAIRNDRFMRRVNIKVPIQVLKSALREG